MSRSTAIALVAGIAAVLSPLARGAEGPFKVAPLKEAPPAETAEKVREAVAAEGLRVTDKDGKPFVDVWLRKSVTTVEAKPELGVKLGQVPEGTLIGLLRFHRKGSDFKGNDFPEGLYTARIGLQPIDGDHQGVSETRDFLLLAPAKVDQKPDAMSIKEAIKLSVQSAGIKHPTVLWLRKVAGEDARLPRLVEESELGLWSLECEVPTAGDKGPLRLSIVLVGAAAEH